MSFPQAWEPSDHAVCSNGGLVVIKSAVRPAAISIVSDCCIPSKHIILSSPSSESFGDLDSIRGMPPIGVRIDSTSGVPNAACKTSVKLPSEPSVTANGIARTSSAVGGSSEEFIDEIGVSRSSLRRLHISAITGPIYYFEVTVTSPLTPGDQNCGVAVGLSSVESVHTYGMDQCPLSVGYHSSGRVIHDAHTEINAENGFGTHDTVGCGLEIGGKGRVFFTCNGHVIGINIFNGFGTQGESYFPAIILQGKRMSVQTNFGASALQFRPQGLNICNYAFAFHEDAMLLSVSDTNSSGLDIPNPFADPEQALSDLDGALQPRSASWDPKDISFINSSLQMLEQIAKRQVEKDEFYRKNKGNTLGGDPDLDQAIFDSYQDVFHVKIQRALTSGLKTISDLVQNDCLAHEMHHRVGSFSSYAPSRDVSPSSTPTESTSGSPGNRGRNQFNRSKTTIDMIYMIADSIRPVWQKMLDLISQSLLEPPKPGLDLGELLELNDKLTTSITALEFMFAIRLPRAVNQSTSIGSASSKRRSTDLSGGNSDPLFWPERLSINILGDSSHFTLNDESAVAYDRPMGDHFEFKGHENEEPEQLETVLSPTAGAWSTPRGVDFSPRAGVPPPIALSRQGTRTQVSLPSLHELMASLRRGSAEDVANVADLIYHLFSDMAGYRRRSNSTCPMLQTSQTGMHRVHCSLIKNIVEQGGLLALLQALARCAEWPEVEMKVSRAVTVLATCETDYFLLMRKSDEIITAMNLLLLRGEVLDASGTPTAAAFNKHAQENLAIAYDDASVFQELVAMAVSNICSVIQSTWEKESIDLENDSSKHGFKSDSPQTVIKRAVRSRSVSKSKKITDTDSFPRPSNGSLVRGRSGGTIKSIDGRASGNAQNLTRCVESLLHIITTLIKPPVLQHPPGGLNSLDSDEEQEIFTKTAVLCCQAVCSLTQVSPLKQLVVEKRGRGDEGILEMLVSWVNICADQIAATKDSPRGSITSIDESTYGNAASGSALQNKNPFLFELIESVSCAIAYLCKIDRREPIQNGQSDFDMLRTSEYAVGVIDAQMKAVSVPAAIVKFVDSVCPNVFAEPMMGVNQFPSGRKAAVGSNKVGGSENIKSSIMLPFPISVPSWCDIALMRSTAVHLALALSSMTCRLTNRAPIITSALCSILVTAAAQTTRHRRSRVNFEHPTEEYGPEKLQKMHQREQEENLHLGKVAAACLNGLCSFMNDAVNTSSSALSTQPARQAKKATLDRVILPPIIKEIMSFNVLDTLKLVATLPSGEARLAVFRLFAMLSEWGDCLERMISMNITEILVSYLKDLDDSNEWGIKTGIGNPVPNPTLTPMSAPMGIPQPRNERGISTDTNRSIPSDDANTPATAPLALEELMRVLFFISQVCEHSFQNASKMYDEGLMKVMLNLTKHYRLNVEIQRQALRSISAMCPVLSSITPGGHPAQVIEKLTTAKDSAAIHMVQSKTKNSARRESEKTRLEFNLLIFVEALRALALSLLSPSSLVQKEALRGISFLAVDDQLRVGIVEGPLKQVIRIFLEPSTEQDIKDLAEQVFVNIGFHNGSKDLEIVANDSDLLSDWFYMKRSMRPQALAYDLTRHWIDALFYGDEQAERRARRQFLLAELGRSDCPVNDEMDSLSLHLPGGLAIDLRDTLDLPGLDVLKGMLEKLVLPPGIDDKPTGGLYWGSAVGPAGEHSGLRDALHQQFLFLYDSWQMLNQMYFVDHIGGDQLPANVLNSPYFDVLPAAGSKQRTSPSANALSTNPASAKKKKSGVSLFSDTFFRYINHCSVKLSAQRIIAEEENERLERELEAERLLMGPLSAITSDISVYSSHGKSLHHTPSKSVEVRPLRKKQTSWSSTDGIVPLYDDIGSRVVELLDYIFPSKLFQMYLCDLIVCGGSYRATDFSIPDPRQFRALLLPPRPYISFHREGRVIERILDDIKTKGYQSEKPTFDYKANVLSFGHEETNKKLSCSGKCSGVNATSAGVNCPASVLWAISFRDSKFDGEFFATFSNTLHKCPSISALNFSMQAPTLDSRLGYMAGNVPPTVHFLTFENALSSDSLQIMCVLLRTQNAAWRGAASLSNRKNVSNVKDQVPSNRGLFGLAIRMHSLTDEDVKHLSELLDPLGLGNKFVTSDYSAYKSPSQLQRSMKTPQSPIQTVAATVIGESGGSVLGEATEVLPSGVDSTVNRSGLKFLDLSDNRLSDAQCGEILKSCVFGPLEGLELGGNLIQRGLYFISSLQGALENDNLALKHLGISFCGLVPKSFAGILGCITHAKYPSLTSLDASSNSLTHSPEIKEALHELLKRNRTLRIIDLSDNNFNNETVRAINLGLLENESTVLLLKITVNSTMKVQELKYVRDKLWKNREHYAAQRRMQGPRLGPSRHEAGIHDYNCAENDSRERLSFDVADAISHTMSLPGFVPGTLPDLSREFSTSLSAASHVARDSTSPMRRVSTDPANPRSMLSSKESRKASEDACIPAARTPIATADPYLRSVSNPFITVSDIGRRRSGTGVSSQQEALEAVSRFAEDGSKLPQALVLKRPQSIRETSTGSSGDIDSSGRDGVLLVDDAVPVAVNAVAIAEDDLVVRMGRLTNVAGNDSGEKAIDEELNKSTRSTYSENTLPDFISKELWVLFSAPLAWRDAESGVLKPIEMLNYKNEKDTLWQVFREGQRDIDLHFNYATTDQLRTAVTLGCKALHFSGHGHPDWLNFEDGRSGLQIVTVERLEKLCSAGGIKLDFVFVSACYSRNAGEAFAAAGVKHVVCVSVDAQLLDTAATIFTRAFYLALVVGENVDKAFEIGQNAVAASPSVPNSMKEQDKFLLLPQDKPHNVPIFKAPGVSRWPPENSAAMRWEERLTPDYLPEPPEDFEGRECDMYEVITALHKRHLVSIVGERGVGKSAVAVASMRYLTERNVFENGAVYVRLQHVTSYEGFLTTFERALTSTCPAAASKLHQLESSMRRNDSSNDLTSNRYKKNPLFTQEDLLISCVSALKLLIVFDHVNGLLTTGEVGTDVTMFLGSLLEGRRNIRVLLTSTVGVGMINGFGIVEKCVKLGPLTLYNSLRLFARLTPTLVTAKQRLKFIQSLTPKPLDVSGNNPNSNIDLLPEAKKILGLLGNGHPDKIVKLAVESDADSVILLKTNGMNIIASALLSRCPPSPMERPPSVAPTPTRVSSGSGLAPVPLSVGPITSVPATPAVALPATPAAHATPPVSYNSPPLFPAAFSPANLSMTAFSTGAIDPFEYYENDVTQSSAPTCSFSVAKDISSERDDVKKSPNRDA